MAASRPFHPVSVQNSSAPSTIFFAGALAGVLDLSDAVIISALRGVSPLRVLQYIASGLLGSKSFSGGLLTTALGAACHFGITFIAASIFYAAARMLPLLRKRPILSGILYGGAVYVVMNFVVLPLSAIPPRRPASAAMTIQGVLAVLLLVGLPISWITARSLPPPAPPNEPLT